MGTKQGNKWMRDLLMTVIGTTISIVLTFGTSGIIEKSKKKTEGRQMAMMVIHDIDNTAEAFHQLSREEDENFKLSQQILSRLDDLDSFSDDTLNTAMLFIMASNNKGGYFDDSSEQVFLSSQDSWKNINNAAFIDAVTEFFHTRRQTYESVNNGMVWEKPVDPDEYYGKQMKSEGYEVNAKDFIAEYFSRERVKYYIELSPARQRAYNQVADNFEMTSKRCKFMMGITDDELQKYVQSRNNPGKRVREKDLIGKWVLASNDTYFQGFEFKEDHSVTTTVIQHYNDAFYVGTLDFLLEYKGTWAMQGDSLTTSMNPRYEYSLDTSGVHSLPGKEQYVKELVEFLEERIIAQQNANESAGLNSLSYKLSLDPSGDRIEMTTAAEGTEVEYYISREK